MKENGLHLTEIQTGCTILNAVEDIPGTLREQFPKPGWFVAYLDYAVLIGTYADNRLQCFQEEDTTLLNTAQPAALQRLRVFHADAELHLWRTAAGFAGRLRTDGEGESIYIVEACQALFGTTAEAAGSRWTTITEKRGTRLLLPFPNLSVNDQKQRVFLKTRNYIGKNAVHQATYQDCRFVCFTRDYQGKDRLT